MPSSIKYIGHLDHQLSDLSAEYLSLAADDEQAGNLLLARQKYRHAVYFFVQAMEKLVRHKIFMLVNPQAEYFRNRTRTHNLDELLDFLIEIASSQPPVREQVRTQLETYVLGGIRFGKLHNDLRYPSFSERSGAYAMLRVDEADAQAVFWRSCNG